MQIITKGNAGRVEASREVHHLSARKELENEYKWREAVLRGDIVHNSEEAGGGSYRPLDRLQDPQEMRKTMKDFKRNYERGLPPELSSATRNYLWKRAKFLKDQFTIGMLRKSELHPVSQRQINKNGQLVTAVVADYDKIRETKAIEREAAWHKKNGEYIKEFKNIMRQLEPNNPNLPNIERFRKS